jgi:prepilin-type N-terminal cleavage/methylation domain-containing protein
MIKLKNKDSGFTIIELLIVIVVIGILAAIVITTYSGIQAKARNAVRQTDIQSIQTQLEAYYSQNGHYPSNADLNSASWRAANMPSLDPNALIDPSSGDTTSNVQVADNSTGQAKEYSYYPVDSTGSSANCEANDTTCSAYTLVATYEGTVNGQTTYVKQNLD